MLDDQIRRIEAALAEGTFDFCQVCCEQGEWSGSPDEPPVCCGRPLSCADDVRALLDRLKAAEQRAEYWKSEHLAANTEIERLQRWEGAAREWLDKTEWVQERIDSGHLSAKYLGKHRADIMRAEVDRLRATLARLACLGNGDSYGNSEGNMIARAALEDTDE